MAERNNAVDLFMKSRVLFSLEQFVPANDKEFDTFEFVQNNRSRFSGISSLKEELLKSKALIESLLEETVKKSYSNFIEFSRILNQIKSELEKICPIFYSKLLKEEASMKELYEECLLKIEECEKTYKKMKKFRNIKQYCTKVLFLKNCLLTNIKSNFARYQNIKKTQNEKKKFQWLLKVTNSISRFSDYHENELDYPQDEIHQDEMLIQINNIKIVLFNIFNGFKEKMIQEFEEVLNSFYFDPTNKEKEIDKDNNKFFLDCILELKCVKWYEKYIKKMMVKMLIQEKKDNLEFNFDQVLEKMDSSFKYLNENSEYEQINVKNISIFFNKK